jgi:hypothetical protein
MQVLLCLLKSYAVINICSPRTMSGRYVDIELQRLSEDAVKQDKLYNETQDAEHEPLLANIEYVNLSRSAATKILLT